MIAQVERPPPLNRSSSRSLSHTLGRSLSRSLSRSGRHGSSTPGRDADLTSPQRVPSAEEEAAAHGSGGPSPGRKSAAAPDAGDLGAAARDEEAGAALARLRCTSDASLASLREPSRRCRAGLRLQ